MKYGSKTWVCVFLLLCVFSFVSFDARPSVAAEYKWSFAQPWTRPLTDASFNKFCERIKEYSGGRIEVTFFPNGQLGGHDENFHAMQEGSLEVGVFSPYPTLIPGGCVPNMPWVITNWDEMLLAYRQPDGILYRVMQDAFEEVDGHLLFVISQGAYGLGNNKRPLQIPADLENLKLRVSASPGGVKSLTNMGEGKGVSLATIPWGELYNALSRGVVDGCWTTWASLVEERHNEVLKHFSDLNFIWDSTYVVINKELWESLPEDLKEAVTKASIETAEELIAVQKKAEEEFIAKLKEKEGFTITWLTSEERDAFRAASKMGPMWEELCGSWINKRYPGQNMIKTITDELEKNHQEVIAKQNNQ
jgi:TRAP-type C4-dicarboxylate transport system substrate-binding protein